MVVLNLYTHREKLSFLNFEFPSNHQKNYANRFIPSLNNLKIRAFKFQPFNKKSQLLKICKGRPLFHSPEKSRPRDGDFFHLTIGGNFQRDRFDMELTTGFQFQPLNLTVKSYSTINSY